MRVYPDVTVVATRPIISGEAWRRREHRCADEACDGCDGNNEFQTHDCFSLLNPEHQRTAYTAVPAVASVQNLTRRITRSRSQERREVLRLGPRSTHQGD